MKIESQSTAPNLAQAEASIFADGRTLDSLGPQELLVVAYQQALASSADQPESGNNVGLQRPDNVMARVTQAQSLNKTVQVGDKDVVSAMHDMRVSLTTQQKEVFDGVLEEANRAKLKQIGTWGALIKHHAGFIAEYVKFDENGQLQLNEATTLSPKQQKVYEKLATLAGMQVPQRSLAKISNLQEQRVQKTEAIQATFVQVTVGEPALATRPAQTAPIATKDFSIDGSINLQPSDSQLDSNLPETTTTVEHQEVTPLNFFDQAIPTTSNPPTLEEYTNRYNRAEAERRKERSHRHMKSLIRNIKNGFGLRDLFKKREIIYSSYFSDNKYTEEEFRRKKFKESLPGRVIDRIKGSLQSIGNLFNSQTRSRTSSKALKSEG